MNLRPLRVINSNAVPRLSEVWHAPPEGVDRRVHLRSLLPTVEVNGKRYLEGGRLGVVQEEAADVAALAAASSSAGEVEGMCVIM